MIADMSLNATSWRRRRRFTTSLRPSQSSPHAPFLKCGLFACSALNARSNDCHVGLLCMTQRAQYRTQMWVRTLCVVVRTDFLCYPLHFQHKKLNSPWRCSRVPVRADPLRVGCLRGPDTEADWHGSKLGRCVCSAIGTGMCLNLGGVAVLRSGVASEMALFASPRTFG